MIDNAKMREEDYLTQRRDFISDQHAGFHQSHIEIIKSLFTLSLVSLGFNFGVLETWKNNLEMCLWLLSSTLFVTIIILCFALFHITKSRQTGMVELLQDELDIPQSDYDERRKKIERHTKTSNNLMSISYALFLVSIVAIFLRIFLN